AYGWGRWRREWWGGVWGGARAARWRRVWWAGHMSQASNSCQAVSKEGCGNAGRSSSTSGWRERIMVHMGGPPFLGVVTHPQRYEEPPPPSPLPRTVGTCSPVHKTCESRDTRNWQTCC